MAKYVIGVDGGTTKTIALLADDRGQVCGAARGGGSNWTGPDVEVPMRVVAETVRQALQQANVKGRDVAMGIFCLAGADWPEDHERRHAVLKQAGLARQVLVKNDVFAGLRAGTHQPYGVGIVAGTGTNTAVIAPNGQEWAFGYYKTYGGARDMAQEAVYAVLRAEDGRGAPTALSARALTHLGYPTVEAMLRASVAGEIEHSRYLALCPHVFEAAEAGDQVAAEIVVKQGLALAEYATAVIRRFKMQCKAFDVVLSGSVFKGTGPLLIDTITQAVHRVAPYAHIVRAQLEPAVGALLLAYDALDIAVSDEMYEHLAQTAPGSDFFDTTDGGEVQAIIQPVLAPTKEKAL